MHLFIYLMYISDCVKIIILIISDSMADIYFYICFLVFFFPFLFVTWPGFQESWFSLLPPVVC